MRRWTVLWIIFYASSLATRCARLVSTIAEPAYLRIHNAVKNRLDRYWKERWDIWRLRRRHGNRRQYLDYGYRLKLDELGFSDRQLARVAASAETEDCPIIADIDQDGFIRSRIGPVPGLPSVDPEKFVERKRFGVHLVAIDGYVGIKKEYRGALRPFLREYKALLKLGRAGCRVPGILDVDFDNLIIIISYIPGKILREELAEKGAVVRDRDFVNQAELHSLTFAERVKWAQREGRKYLNETVSSGFVAQLFTELKKVHAARFIWGDIKYGNVVIESRSGDPYLIDFDSSAGYPSLPQRLFRQMRDQDIHKFNVNFATEHLTYKSATEKIRAIEAERRPATPVHFGYGLRLGTGAACRKAFRAWHRAATQAIPDPSGKRILAVDLGSISECIQFLKGGARESVAIFRDRREYRHAIFAKELFEYLDNTIYPLELVCMAPEEYPAMNLADFDLVNMRITVDGTDDPALNRSIDAISGATSTLLLEAHIEASARDEISDAEAFVIDSLKHRGFSTVDLAAEPTGYSRLFVAIQ